MIVARVPIETLQNSYYKDQLNKLESFVAKNFPKEYNSDDSSVVTAVIRILKKFIDKESMCEDISEILSELSFIHENHKPEVPDAEDSDNQ